MNLQRMIDILKKIFKLPPIPTILISIPSFVLVIYVLANDVENTVISYVAYTLSAYAMVIVITGMSEIVRLIRRGIEDHPFIKKILSIPILEKYWKEVLFRTETSLYQGLFINLLYVGLKFGSGIYYRSIWFGSLAVYYLLLAVMRFSLLHYVRSRKRDKSSEWKRYRFCGIVLLVMNQALTAIVVIVVKQNKAFEYAGFLIYAMALYAFYAVITSVINVVKFRKYGSPVMSAAKVINLTAALVSMLSLETAMLAQFGEDDVRFRLIMTSATGAGVCMIVLGMAVFMIVKSTKVLKNINQDEIAGGNVL
ncbi:MAG: hypothetical protein K2N15_08040 [Lachnospiraceae bacterium]|nr:hypothetical protein [Lachnospiraceae bacterium]